LYPTQVGVLKNGPGLTDAQLPCETLPELLRRAGYQTAGFGKTHWSVESGCSRRGFELRYTSTDEEEKGAVLQSEHDPDGLRRYYEETKPCGGGGQNNVGYLGFTSKVAEAEHRDGWALARCLEFLDNDRDPKRPLFLYFSCLAPHAPHNIIPGFEELYGLDAIPVPEQPSKDQVEPCHASGLHGDIKKQTFWSKATRRQWQQMSLRYRANCTWVDSLYRRVLEKLEAQGVLDNCLIVYVSDHGEMLGERYYRFAKYCLYEPSARVPVILAGTAIPEDKKNSVDHRSAELIDIMPTILHVAGVDDTCEKPGENLLGPTARKASFCEFSDQPKVISFMWRTPDRKLILTFSKDCLEKQSVQPSEIIAGEFYDLRKDPKEWNNLYGNEEVRATQDRMTDELIAHLNSGTLKRKRP